jgi:hypothetical protein
MSCPLDGAVPNNTIPGVGIRLYALVAHTDVARVFWLRLCKENELAPTYRFHKNICVVVPSPVPNRW